MSAAAQAATLKHRINNKTLTKVSNQLQNFMSNQRIGIEDKVKNLAFYLRPSYMYADKK